VVRHRALGREPDILTSGKGHGEWHANRTYYCHTRVADSFTGLTFATFGGNPVSTAAALATISVIESDDLRANARNVGAYLRQGMESLRENYENRWGCARTRTYAGNRTGLKTGSPKSRNPQALLLSLKRRGSVVF